MVPGMAQAAYAPIGMPTTLTPSLFPQAYAEEFQEQLQKDPKPLFDLGMNLQEQVGQKSREEPTFSIQTETITVEQARASIQGVKPYQIPNVSEKLKEQVKPAFVGAVTTATALDLGSRSLVGQAEAQTMRTATALAQFPTAQRPVFDTPTPDLC